jgi:hypothetical protein
MATLTSKKFATLVGDFAAAVQGTARTLLDFTIGSILRAVAEATAGVGLWLQALCYQVLQATRLATSTGTDLDTFFADFGLTRLPAVSATGDVTFARFTATGTAVVPVGAKVATTDGSQVFEVIANPLNAYYSATAAPGNLPGYTFADGVVSHDLPVQAVTLGSQGNVSTGAIQLLQTGISGIDTVVNPGPMADGADAETDAAARIRFRLYINSLAKATPGAIGFAILSTQLGLQYTITENKDYAGATVYGMVTVIVDDGSGAIPSDVLTAVTNAIGLTRAASVRVGVFAATKTMVTVGMTITTLAGYDHPTVVAQVGAALVAYINNLGLGNGLPYTRLEQVAYDASPGVSNVSSVLLQGATADLPANAQVTYKTIAGNVTVA